MQNTLLLSLILLAKKHAISGTVLIGFSGGPDSTALLHLLIEASKILKLDLHIAHVDHGLRPESQDECDLLKNRYKAFPFHSTRLNIEGANLEDRCREARLEFFGRIYQEIGANFLILAHHADDQAETMLKRIFEGGRLIGLQEMRELRKMRVFRPLLTARKAELINYLEQRQVSYLLDPTNQNGSNLRSRMRGELLPLIEHHFGKGITNNLGYLSLWATDIEDYLSQDLPLLGSDFSKVHPAKLRHFLRVQGKISRSQVETVIRLVKEKAHKKEVGPYEIHMGTLQLKEKLPKLVVPTDA